MCFKPDGVNSDKGGNDGILLSQGFSQGQKIVDTISVIIDEQNNNKEEIEKNNDKAHYSIADELMKLSELKNDGVLTEDEFQLQKSILLSKQKIM